MRCPSLIVLPFLPHQVRVFRAANCSRATRPAHVRGRGPGPLGTRSPLAPSCAGSGPVHPGAGPGGTEVHICSLPSATRAGPRTPAQSIVGRPTSCGDAVEKLDQLAARCTARRAYRRRPSRGQGNPFQAAGASRQSRPRAGADPSTLLLRRRDEAYGGRTAETRARAAVNDFRGFTGIRHLTM